VFPTSYPVTGTQRLTPSTWGKSGRLFSFDEGLNTRLLNWLPGLVALPLLGKNLLFRGIRPFFPRGSLGLPNFCPGSPSVFFFWGGVHFFISRSLPFSEGQSVPRASTLLSVRFPSLHPVQVPMAYGSQVESLLCLPFCGFSVPPSNFQNPHFPFPLTNRLEGIFFRWES